jgi:hypothetical protein
MSVPYEQTNISGTVLTSTSVRIDWYPLANPAITGYRIICEPKNNNPNLVDKNARFMIITDLTPSTTYTFTLVPILPTLVPILDTTPSGNSSSVNVTPYPLTLSVPYGPTHISGTVIDSTSVNITWSEPIFNGNSPITGYRIICVPDNNKINLTNNPDDRSMTITGLNASTTYTFTVLAINLLGNSSSINVIAYTNKLAILSYNCACKGTSASVNTPITPSEGSRIDSLSYYGSKLGVTQARVKELLKRGLQFGNEGTRIARLQELTVSSSYSLLNRPIILPRCPPLPPPAAPPARACVLTKNQK